MKNGHNDVLEPIGAIPFLFSTRSFLANGFSTLRLLAWRRSVLPTGAGLENSPAGRSCGARFYTI
jgi:hypothetical protein